MARRICWITWEDHRRSRELAKRLAADYVVLRSNGRKGIRHFLLALKTIVLLWRRREYIIIVQNPSRVLAAVSAGLKIIFGYPLIVDRHTNFRLGKGFSFNPTVWFMTLCSEFSLRFADLTIVTNEYLKELVDKKGGRGFVLTDPIPELCAPGKKKESKGIFTVFFVCTFSSDEPYEEVIEAGRIIGDKVVIQISGNYSKADLDPKNIPSNVKLMGFVPNEQYDVLINSADTVIALTSAEWCLVCGGYEAIAAKKPLITSNTKALKAFYGTNAIFVEHTAEEISKGICTVMNHPNSYSELAHELYKTKEKEWLVRLNNFNDILGSIV